MNSLNSLADRQIVVTGAGRGLGRAMAEALAGAGATVYGISRARDELEDLERTCASGPGRVVPVPADVSDAADLDRAATVVLSSAGRVDVLVNNAGNNIKGLMVPLPTAETAVGASAAADAFTRSDWDAIMDTHVRGSVQLINSFVPGMLESQHGRIINIGSSALRRTPRLVVPYQVAKGVMEHLTRALAFEWASHGVTVNMIAPGHFRTSMTKVLHDSVEGQRFLRERIPVGHAGNASELGALVVHLAGDSSSFTTGQTIFVDGGETL